MTVFAPQHPFPNKNGFTPDISSAAEYGPLEFVFASGEKVHMIASPSLEKARRVLKNFNPDVDYILWPGNTCPVAWTLMNIALTELNLEHLTILKWDRKRNDEGQRDGRSGYYTPIRINVRKPKID